MDFSQIALLFVVAAGFGVIAKALRQPLFVGYLLAGVLLSATGLLTETASFQSLGHIGVSLLLFLMGLEMSLKEVVSVGKVSVFTAIGQIIFSFLTGFIVSRLFGFTSLTAFYVGVALSFSSTIISVKLLSEKEDLLSLYGRISIGILLIQDLVAVFLLIFLTTLGKGDASFWVFASTLIKGVTLIVAVWYLSKKIFPQIFEKIAAGSTELMFIVSIAWALGFSAFVQKYVGFTIEIGGFLAGLSLSSLPEHLQIATKARSVRDFFLTIFFLVLGTGVFVTNGFLQILFPAITISVLILFVHTFSVMALMGFQGFKKRTSFLVGSTISQISEFSLIISAVGLNLNQLDRGAYSMITMIGVITMIASTYIIGSAEGIYDKLKNILSVFERGRTKEKAYLPNEKMDDHIVVVGAYRTGKQIVDYLSMKKKDFIVIDFDPKVFTSMTAKGINVVFGDINDIEILESANINRAKLVILTTSNLSDNLNFLSYIKSIKSDVKTIITSRSRKDAISLYEAGASYVIVPDVVTGDYIKHLLKVYGTKGERLSNVGQSHFKRMLFV